MNGLSDSLTIGVVITLVFGALFFYLYSRLVQNEKRVSLIENILLDLKMSADAGYAQGAEDSGLQTVDHIEPVSGPEPLEKEDVDDEDLYKDILASVPAPKAMEAPQPMEEEGETKQFEVAAATPKGSSTGAVQVTKVQPNYSSMTVKELKGLAKQRGLGLPQGAGRKELTDALRKSDGQGPAAPEGGSFLSPSEGAPLEEVDQDAS
jgi:hypothetical protein